MHIEYIDVIIWHVTLVTNCFLCYEEKQIILKTTYLYETDLVSNIILLLFYFILKNYRLSIIYLIRKENTQTKYFLTILQNILSVFTRRKKH